MRPTGDLQHAPSPAPPPSMAFPPETVALCARLRPRFVRIARALLHDAADAEDATQAALLEVLRWRDTFRGEGRLDGFCDRIAVRTTLRMARQRRVRGLRLDDAEPDALPQEPAAPSMREALPRELGDYLDELPEARRTVLVLRHALGYSIAEIAELTGVSENTVKDRLLAAREQVRRRVRQDVVVGTARRHGP